MATRPPGNPFSTRLAAELYRDGRPSHHPRAVRRVMAIIGERPRARILDVACGTGLSTSALRAVSTMVIGTDPSADMIDLAPRHRHTHYVEARAEVLPFADASFDGLTISSGLHWFDQSPFFAEARRVLRAGGWLASYDHYFMSEIPGDTRFATWSRDVYRHEFPAPARAQHGSSLSSDVAEGFVMIGAEDYDDPITLDHHHLVRYLLSQSNCIAALEEGRIDVSSLRDWLTTQTAPFFSPEAGASRPFRFKGKIRCLGTTGANGAIQ